MLIFFVCLFACLVSCFCSWIQCSPSLDPSTVLEVETKLAQIFVPRTDLRCCCLPSPHSLGDLTHGGGGDGRDPYKTNSMRTLGEIKQMVQQFDWDIYFNILRVIFDSDTNYLLERLRVS